MSLSNNIPYSTQTLTKINIWLIKIFIKKNQIKNGNFHDKLEIIVLKFPDISMFSITMGTLLIILKHHLVISLIKVT